jgi:hypothetical protein
MAEAGQSTPQKHTGKQSSCHVPHQHVNYKLCLGKRKGLGQTKYKRNRISLKCNCSALFSISVVEDHFAN